MSDPKTNQPVPLWYRVTVKFSDGYPSTTEDWTEKRFADGAVEAWRNIEALAEGSWHITDLTVTSMYTPPPGNALYRPLYRP